MCTIFGQIKTKEDGLLTETRVLEILSKTKSRGPEFEDVKIINNNLLFAHQRLSILDLDKRSNQPYNYKNITITFNGEIFNFKELRDDLINLGYLFETTSDTEVICKGIHCYGRKFLNKMNGMFSISCYDSILDKLILVRDRYGIKPLYYTRTKGSLFFGSEIKLLTDLTELTKDKVYVERYLQYTKTDQDERTHFANIKQVPPGFYIEISSNNLSIKKSRWYNYSDFNIREEVFQSFEKTRDYFEDLLVDSIKLRLRSDVPYCITLSGGLDSSTIYTLIKERLKVHIQPFTLTHNNKSMDESPLVLKLTQEYSDNVDFIKSEKGLKTFKEFRNQQLLLDFPIWNNSTNNYLDVYKKIKDSGYTVVIEGHGADELLGGYPYMIDAAIYSAVRKLKFKRVLDLIYLKECTEKDFLKEEISGILWKSLRSIAKGLLGKGEKFNTTLNKAFSEDILPIVLRGFDRITMANSIENRSPFLDYRLVEFSKKIPEKYLIDRNGTKKILRSILLKYNKHYIVNNKEKMGFAGDITSFFNRKEVRKQIINFLQTRSEENYLELKEDALKILQSNQGDLSWKETITLYKSLSVISIFS